MTKPQIAEYFYTKKDELLKESKEKIIKAETDSRNFFNEMKNIGVLLEKERLDNSKLKQNLDLYISRTARQNE
jgi:hypothetical protein